jgi:hypothetical protein
MPEPATRVFTNLDHLVAELRRRRWREDFQKDHERLIHRDGFDLGPLSAIYASVSSSTFRAFRSGHEWTPSTVFREWAGRRLSEGTMKDVLALRSNEEYRTLALGLARNLEKDWKQRLHDPLQIPRALKLVNLLMKGLCVVCPVWPKRFGTLVWFLDVPLDKYSLRPLACIPKLAKLGITWNTATMGSVPDLRTYNHIQDSIHEACARANVPAIAYDFLAWNLPHREVK